MADTPTPGINELQDLLSRYMSNRGSPFLGRNPGAALMPIRTPAQLGVPDVANILGGGAVGGLTGGKGLFGKMPLGAIFNALIGILFGGQAAMSIAEGLGLRDSEGEKQRRHERQMGLANLGGQAMLQADSQHERALARGDRLMENEQSIVDRAEGRRNQADLLRMLMMSQSAGRGQRMPTSQPESPLPFMSQAGLI